jgi:ubiquitin-like domain-containing CTD phosphatase 1
VVDDFDVSYTAQIGLQGKGVVAPADDPRNKRKIQEIVKKIPITVCPSLSGVDRLAYVSRS